MYQIDTSNVLFILSGAFVGLDSIIKRRVAKGVRLPFMTLMDATDSLIATSPSGLRRS